jgi:hypothetical protein
LSYQEWADGCYDGNRDLIGSDCECDSTCGACGFYDDPVWPEDCITCADGSNVTAIFSDGTGCCGEGCDNYDDDYYGEDEPAFFTFIVEEEALNTWGILVAYEEDMSDLTLMTSTEEYCLMSLDESYQGVYVSEYWEGSCPFIEEYGWTYASLTYGSNEEPESITGPFGN